MTTDSTPAARLLKPNAPFDAPRFSVATQPDEPSDPAGAPETPGRGLRTRQLAAGGEPIVRVQSVGAVFAAATRSELRLFAHDGTVRARIPGLARGTTSWEVGPDGAYVAVLEEWGVALYRGDGRRVALPPEDAEPGEAPYEADEDAASDDDDLDDQLLYPNDGIGGVLALNATRLLVYAVGHNVYEPLTVYDPRTGVRVGSQKSPSFSTDPGALPGGERFVFLTDDGALELRASDDGRYLETLGTTFPLEGDWPLFWVVGGGSVIVRFDTRLSIFRPAEPSAKPAAAAGWTSTSLTIGLAKAALIVDADAAFFAVVSDTAAEVYTIEGTLQGQMAFAQPAPKASPPAVISGRFLGRAMGATLTVYDLDALAPCGTFSADAEITALASAPAGFLLGLHSGAVLRVGPESGGD